MRRHISSLVAEEFQSGLRSQMPEPSRGRKVLFAEPEDVRRMSASGQFNRLQFLVETGSCRETHRFEFAAT